MTFQGAYTKGRTPEKISQWRRRRERCECHLLLVGAFDVFLWRSGLAMRQLLMIAHWRLLETINRGQ